MFHNAGANAFAKNQIRLTYKDKRDLYFTMPSDERMPAITGHLSLDAEDSVKGKIIYILHMYAINLKNSYYITWWLRY